MTQLKESGTVEFKRLLNDAAKREIIAFANTDGGDLYIGVDDDGMPVGVADPDAVMGAVGDMIRNAIRPDLTAYTSIDCEPMQGDDGTTFDVIHITVLRGTRRPYYLASKGMRPVGIFIRHGVSAVPAGEERIRQMIRDDDGTAFDTAVSVDQELTFGYADTAFQRRHLSLGEPQRRSLGLTNADGLYTNVAMLLSNQCRHSIKCAVYQGTTKARFLAREEFHGSVLRQLDEASRYLELNNPTRSDIIGLYRNDSYAYPPSALREALVNAVTHRDYDRSGPILISVFSDRIEFVSLGGLVKGISLTDLTNGISQPRNKALADVLYRLELIEGYGSGIPRIMEEYAGNSAPPVIRITPGAFTLSLPKLDGNGDGGMRAVSTSPDPAVNGMSRITDATNPFPVGPDIRIDGDMQTAVLAGYPTGEGVGTLALAPVARAHDAGPSSMGTISTDSPITANPIETSVPHNRQPQTPPSGTLEKVTLELLAQAQSGMSRMEIQQRLGINKNRAAYVLRKLEHEGSIVTTGTARNTRYAIPQ